MKKIIFALAMSLFMIPAMAQHHDNHHDNHHDIHHDDHHNHHDDRHHPAPVIRVASPEEVAIIRQLVHDLTSSWDQAKAVKTWLEARDLLQNKHEHSLEIYTSGDTERFAAMCRRLGIRTPDVLAKRPLN